MLSNYAEILRLPGAWTFSLAGFILRIPMSLVGISTILLIKAMYGNYTTAGAVSAVSVIGVVVGAPILARLVDAHGQRRVMGPALTISTLALAGLVVTAVSHAPIPVLFIAAAVSGASWGSPGALVRSRWSLVATSPRQLNTAYALEAAIDEFVFIVGPILATTLGTAIHPASGLVLAIVCLTIGGVAFLGQRATEPPVVARVHGEKRPTVLLNPVVVVLALTYIGAGTMFGANDVAVVAFTEEHGAPQLAGLLLAFFALGSFTAALIYGARTWRQPLWKLFAIGVVLLALGASTFLLARSLVMLGIIMWITGLTIAPTMTNVNTIISKVVPRVQLTEGLTWMSTAMNLGASAGSFLGGRAIDAQGAHGGFLVVVVFAWVMAVLMLVGLPRLRRDTGKDEVATTVDERHEPDAARC
ncbi:MFS transporter [Brooklawnia cerclae]|uniref:MFS family permease n=1 Tax=Brooklawnia cerclae TaxID=349934 RepID=A0ABX0SHV4_9ACTN|nr:MFS family permease [Brooklawnia cerclae]